ncbi:hypothetical protein AKO1_012147 [Acrasis kona]|uniref:Teneurin NHL domain-containing protein n=1 Tax=Acrasis kona TaxID=1008807 RepID=A0AAW2ZDG5_9EUKA
MAFDSDANVLYFTEQGNNYIIRKWNRTSNIISLVAGQQGSSGTSGNNVIATSAQLCNPFGLTLDTENKVLYLADVCFHGVRRITLNTGIISTFAGGNGAGFSGDNGLATSAQFNNPYDVTVDSGRKLVYIADYSNYIIRVVNQTTGVVRTIAGTQGSYAYGGDGGLATSAKLTYVMRLTLDKTRNQLYFTDKQSRMIRGIDLSSNVIQTVVGAPFQYSGPSYGARLFGQVYSAKYDNLRNQLYITDATSHRVMVINRNTNIIQTILGAGPDAFTGSYDTVAINSPSFFPVGISLDVTNNLVYVAEFGVHTIRVINRTSGMVTRIAGTGVCGYSGDGGLALSAQICNPYGILYDSSTSTVYFTSYNNHVIRSIKNGVINTVVGTGVSGYNGNNQVGNSTQLFNPSLLSIDVSRNILYFPDSNNNIVRAWNRTSNIVTNIAGIPGSTSYSGDKGPALSASINYPTGVTFNSNTNQLYVTDTRNQLVRVIDMNTGTITKVTGIYTVASSTGDGGILVNATLNLPNLVEFDNVNNVTYIVENNYDQYLIDTAIGNWNIYTPTTAINSQLNAPQGLCYDSTKNRMYVNDKFDNVVKMVDLNTNVATVIAGSGVEGYSGDGGLATNAKMYNPRGCVVDTVNNYLYITEYRNKVIRMVDLNTNIISTVVGNNVDGYTPDGSSPVNPMTGPSTVALDSANNLLYWVEENRHVARYLNRTDNKIYTAAGVQSSSGAASSTPVPAVGNKLCSPWGINLDSLNNVLYISELCGNVVRMVNRTSGMMSIYAGNGTAGYAGDGGLSTNALLNLPCHTQVDNSRNILYISDFTNRVVRSVSTTSKIISTIAGNYTMGGGYANDGGPATYSQFSNPNMLALDTNNNQLYVADVNNAAIRTIDLSTNNIRTNVGGPTNYRGPALNARILNLVYDVKIEQERNLMYFVDGASNTVKVVDKYINTVSTFAGLGASNAGYNGDNILATSATLNGPRSLAVDTVNNLVYIADFSNNMIRVVNRSNGIISRFAGNGVCGNTGDGGPATSAQICSPFGMVLDTITNTLYFSTHGHHVIRSVRNGTINAVAGNGTAGYNGNNIAAVNAQLNFPCHLSIDYDRNLIYVADTNNHIIRSINRTSGIIGLVAGTPKLSSYNGDDQLRSSASVAFSYPNGVTYDSKTNAIYVADTGNYLVRIIDLTTNIVTSIAGNRTASSFGDKGLAANAGFASPFNVAVDTRYNSLYVSDLKSIRVLYNNNSYISLIVTPSTTYLPTVAKVPTPWACVWSSSDNNYVPSRINEQGVGECMSSDGSNCLWTGNCVNTLLNPPNPIRPYSQPLFLSPNCQANQNWMCAVGQYFISVPSYWACIWSPNDNAYVPGRVTHNNRTEAMSTDGVNCLWRSSLQQCLNTIYNPPSVLYNMISPTALTSNCSSGYNPQYFCVIYKYFTNVIKPTPICNAGAGSITAPVISYLLTEGSGDIISDLVNVINATTISPYTPIWSKLSPPGYTNSINFNFTNSYFRIPFNSFNPLLSFTIVTWVRFNALATYQTFFYLHNLMYFQYNQASRNFLIVYQWRTCHEYFYSCY